MFGAGSGANSAVTFSASDPCILGCGGREAGCWWLWAVEASGNSYSLADYSGSSSVLARSTAAAASASSGHALNTAAGYCSAVGGCTVLGPSCDGRSDRIAPVSAASKPTAGSVSSTGSTGLVGLVVGCSRCFLCSSTSHSTSSSASNGRRAGSTAWFASASEACSICLA